jgi:hypothetical protein
VCVHELFGHLGYDTIFDACEMIHGVDLLKALRLLKVVQQGHCDTCCIQQNQTTILHLEMKSDLLGTQPRNISKSKLETAFSFTSLSYIVLACSIG